MRKTLLTLLAAGLFLVFTAGSCFNVTYITGSDNYITKEVATNQFNAIQLLGSANITYHQDSTSHVEIYASDNIIPLLDTYVENGTLIIKLKDKTYIRKGKIEIKAFSPDMNNLSINGAGNVGFANGIQTSKDIELCINGSGDIQGKGFNCQRLSISINGSGNVKLQQIQSQECSAEISGSGDISLDGKTIRAKYQIAGSGAIKADNLVTEDVAANIAGVGNISCYVNNKLVARVAGIGKVGFKGNPREIDAPQKNIQRIE